MEDTIQQWLIYSLLPHSSSPPPPKENIRFSIFLEIITKLDRVIDLKGGWQGSSMPDELFRSSPKGYTFHISAKSLGNHNYDSQTDFANGIQVHSC